MKNTAIDLMNETDHADSMEDKEALTTSAYRTLSDEEWECPWEDTRESFPEGCGPDCESSETLFPDRPISVIREIIHYRDTGKTIRVRCIT